MAHSIYLTSPEGRTGKSTIALGLVDLFARRVRRLGVFRPLVTEQEERDSVTELLVSHEGVDQEYEESVGVTYAEVHEDTEAALSRIVQRYQALAQRCDFVIIVGSDYTDVAGPTELPVNGQIAANLGAPTLLVVRGLERSIEELYQVIELASSELRSAHASVVAVAVNRVPAEQLSEVRSGLVDLELPAWAFAEIPLLSAATVAEVSHAMAAHLYAGDESLLDREVESVLVCGMNVDHILQRLDEGQLAIAAGDRSEVLLALASAHASRNFPSLAGVVLNGGYEPSPQIAELVGGLSSSLPILATDHDTFTTAKIASSTRGMISRRTQRKRDLALASFESAVDTAELLHALDVPDTDVITPLMFEARLLERARAVPKHIVLSEGEEDRILRAASTLLARGVVQLTLLGDPDTVRNRARELGLALDGAEVIDPANSAWRQTFAKEYTHVRSHRGMTQERALEVMTSPAYFATMMVQLGKADGMVAGAVHTTAHTIRPAFEIIKTEPGTSIVSSVFLMSLPDRVLVYGDCAVNPEPDAGQLADIAVSSAATAQRFGIEPRVAMLSYSTGSSGGGSEVEKVREATETVRSRRPDLLVEGPIQYDAAVDTSVAATKMPDSAVAGRATVFIFPDLNTGNNTYKAVQRSAGAVAIGPVLQGLNKPVNDLSRGASVQDILNTVAITAIQAQSSAGRQA